jgi:uncharacterized membrane protein
MDTLFFHPSLVHVPVALGGLMPLVAGGILLTWWRRWLPRRAWALAVALQVILVGGGLLALRTGEAEEERVERVVPERFIEAHEEAAQEFVWASGAVLALMLLGLALPARRAALPVALAGVLGSVVCLGLAYRTGQSGGSLVYRHGAAQAHVAAVSPSPLPPRAPGSHDQRDRDDD